MSARVGGSANDVDARPAVQADAVVAALRSLETVRLVEHSAVGTYLPGRRVPGVRIAQDRVEVHVALVYPTTLEEGASAVRAALAGVLSARVDVVVDDLLTASDLGAGASAPKRVDIDRPEVAHE